MGVSTNYEILGWSDNLRATEIQVTANYRSAVDWVEGYTNNEGDLKGYVELLIQNDDGEPIASLDVNGWTYHKKEATT